MNKGELDFAYLVLKLGDFKAVRAIERNGREKGLIEKKKRFSPLGIQ